MSTQHAIIEFMANFKLSLFELKELISEFTVTIIAVFELAFNEFLKFKF